MTANGTTKDVLYEGQSRTSDLPSSGNPVTYYNGRDYHFDWSKGRQLTEAVVGGQTVKYAYDMSGVRSSKQVGDTTYTYTTLSGKVMRQQWGNKSLEFVYDDGNQPFAMIYKHGQTTELYYYVLNAQGDVIALLNANGTLAASYNYGAWGNYSVHGADGKKTTDPTFIGHINPLRYRGYYYDRETRLYYLQSRYYDFANCRFINADTFATTDANGFLSANMFAYCENNPIMRTDEDGEIWHIVAGAVIGAGLEVLSQLVTGTKVADINWRGVAVEGFLGAVSSVGIPTGIVSKFGKAAFVAARDVILPTAIEIASQVTKTESSKNSKSSKSNRRINHAKIAITASQASLDSAVSAGSEYLLKGIGSRTAKAVVHSTRQLFSFTFGLISKLWR